MKATQSKRKRASADVQKDDDLDQAVSPDDDLEEIVSDDELEPLSASEQRELIDEVTENAERADGKSNAGAAMPDRRRLEEQLEALKRKESELRRALIVADHPQLAQSIRELEGSVYALARVESKLGQPPSKAEARRREAVEKKLAALRAKRAELDEQVGALESELATLGGDRAELFAAERRQALQQLFETLATHDPALREAGLEVSGLVPEIARWLPEVEQLAEKLVAARDPA